MTQNLQFFFFMFIKRLMKKNTEILVIINKGTLWISAHYPGALPTQVLLNQTEIPVCNHVFYWVSCSQF